VANPLYVVAECPARCGFGDVVVFRSATSSQLYFFSSCCGCAWKEPPLSGDLDEVSSLVELAPEGVRMPTLEELETAGYASLIVREERAEDWIADIPNLLVDDPTT
jgi:hypothetical protein